jgi:hypothetical protein
MEDVGATTTAASADADAAAGVGEVDDRPRRAHAVAIVASAATPPMIHTHGTARWAGSTLSMATRISASDGGSSSSAIFHFTLCGVLDGRDPGLECRATSILPSLRDCTTSWMASSSALIDA